MLMPKLDERLIFNTACQIEARDARSAYLRQACADDQALLARLDRLLRAYDNDGFLKLPAVPEISFAPAVLEGAGTQIGTYKLVEKIGEGGFGIVFVAEQQQPVRRLVALKIVKPGMDTREVVARFEAERQALAMMDHPNIAHVFDGGTTESGRPYFVMELVKGVPITHYCDEQQLTPRDRLALLATVCQAVQHAHQKGVIHRDIKPTNVLVAAYDGVPVPKIIDFGVAKALGERLTERTLVTSYGGIVGTLEYMSPEQAEFNARDVDTRADIYSLGVLLYELLTGTTPLTRERLKQAAMIEALRLVREEDPPKPSTRLSEPGRARTTVSAQRKIEPEKRVRELRGDLDWIVMKALEKDRDRRYQTANGLARDIERFLHDEPVEACPPSAHYRFRKLLRRHRGPAVAVGTVLIVLLAGIATTSWGFLSARAAQRRTEENQRRAEENFELAKDAVDDYLNKVTEDPELKRTNFSLRKKLLESAVPFYERLVERKPGDAAQEAAHGNAYGRLGDLRRQMGETEEALVDYERMRAIFTRLSAEFPAEPQYRESLADARNSLALLLTRLGKRGKAKAAHRDALTIREQLAADFPTVPRYRDDLARTRNNQGRLLTDLGEYAEAERALRAALVIREQLAADFPTEREYREILAGTRTNLGDLLLRQGKLDEAEAAYREALAIREQLVAVFETVPEYRQNLADTCKRLGSLLAYLGKLDEAEATDRTALAILEKLAAEFPTIADYREMLAWTACQLAFLMADRGDLSGYQECCRTMLSCTGKDTDPARAWAFVRASLLLAEGVRDPRDLADLVQSAQSVAEKNELYQWVLFAQGLQEYRSGRFALARTACVNSRQRATVPAVAVMAQMVEAMSLYGLGKTDEAREALAAVGRLSDESTPKLTGGDLDQSWYDWLCCRILRREAKELIEGPK
jgi:eukaryotic-like serine/threonine-protein kinase